MVKKSKITFLMSLVFVMILSINSNTFAIGKALGAFDDYSKEHLVIEDGTIRIEANAYADNKELKSVTIPESVKEIGEGAFKNCINLADVKFNSDDLVCDATAFDNTKWASSQEDFIIIGRVLVRYVGNNTNVRIPGKVIKIGDRAFLDYIALEEVILPEGLEEIGSKAFSSCEKLESVEIPKNTSKIAEDAFNENTKVISYSQKALKNFLGKTAIFGLKVLGISIVVLTVVAIYLSRKKGANGHLSKEYMSQYIVNKWLYRTNVAFSIFLTYMIVMPTFSPDTLTYDMHETLLTISIIGTVGLGIAYILTEVIRDDFPWGLARLVLRTIKTILIDIISLLPLIIILGILYDPSYFGAIMFYPIIFIVLKAIASQKGGEDEVTAYERKLDMQERIMNGGFNAEENYAFGMANKDTERMAIGQLQKDRHKEKMDKFKDDLEKKKREEEDY